MNILLSGFGRSTFKKRFLFAWGVDILLSIVFLLLFWLGLPNSGFGEVFTRIRGAVGVTVVMGLVVLVMSFDALLTGILRSKMKDRRIRR